MAMSLGMVSGPPCRLHCTVYTIASCRPTGDALQCKRIDCEWCPGITNLLVGFAVDKAGDMASQSRIQGYVNFRSVHSKCASTGRRNTFAAAHARSEG